MNEKIRNDGELEARKTDGERRHGNGEYRRPELFLVGSSVEVIQGPMLYAPYRDATNVGYTHWPN